MDKVSEIITIVGEGAIIHLESDNGFGEGSEDFVHLTDVLFDSFRVDNNAIDLDERRRPIELGSDHVRCTLINGWCVCETERNLYVLISAVIAKN